MNERQLRIFYEVSTKLNMTEAANSLYITQPAVSQTIKEIENELGVKLFDRLAKKLFLTTEGEIFATYSRRILNLYDECNEVIKSMKNVEFGKLKIGASTTIGIYILTDIIGKYTKLNKNIDVSIIVENTNNIANLILENKIDFAFVEGPVHSDEIDVKEFWDDELVIVTSIDHPFAKQKDIELQQIVNEKMIMREIGSGTREVFEDILTANNVQIKNYIELGNTEAIKRSVNAGIGITCISKRAIEREVAHGELAAVKLKSIDIFRKLNIIHHKDKNFSELFNNFINFCQKEA